MVSVSPAAPLVAQPAGPTYQRSVIPSSWFTLNPCTNVELRATGDLTATATWRGGAWRVVVVGTLRGFDDLGRPFVGTIIATAVDTFEDGQAASNFAGTWKNSATNRPEFLEIGNMVITGDRAGNITMIQAFAFVENGFLCIRTVRVR